MPWSKYPRWLEDVKSQRTGLGLDFAGVDGQVRLRKPDPVRDIKLMRYLSGFRWASAITLVAVIGFTGCISVEREAPPTSTSTTTVAQPPPPAPATTTTTVERATTY